MNYDVLGNVLCDGCEDKISHSPINSIAEKIIEMYRHQGIIFSDERFHDFSDIKCEIVKKSEVKIQMMCHGNWVIKDADGDAVESAYCEDDFIPLLITDDGLKYCPRSCGG